MKRSYEFAKSPLTEMNVSDLWPRVRGRIQRGLCEFWHRRPITLGNRVPLISFTFDDFPKSALRTGGAILKRHGLRGTYYASLGLMGTQGPTGEIFSREDLAILSEEGHELGCHTFGHCNAWTTKPGHFEASIFQNKSAFDKLLP